MPSTLEGAGGKIRATAQSTVSMEENKAIGSEGPRVGKMRDMSANGVSRLKTSVGNGDYKKGEGAQG